MTEAGAGVVRLARAARESVIAHARQAAPAECCGLLIGRDQRIEEARAARSIADRPTRYRIDPQDHFDALREARQRGAGVVGFYHSHPSSAAVPSETDRAEATYEHHLYLIVGIAAEEAEVRLFAWENGNFHERAFVTVG